MIDSCFGDKSNPRSPNPRETVLSLSSFLYFLKERLLGYTERKVFEEKNREVGVCWDICCFCKSANAIHKQSREILGAMFLLKAVLLCSLKFWVIRAKRFGTAWSFCRCVWRLYTSHSQRDFCGSKAVRVEEPNNRTADKKFFYPDRALSSSFISFAASECFCNPVLTQKACEYYTPTIPKSCSARYKLIINEFVFKIKCIAASVSTILSRKRRLTLCRP